MIDTLENRQIAFSMIDANKKATNQDVYLVSIKNRLGFRTKEDLENLEKLKGTEFEVKYKVIERDGN